MPTVLDVAGANYPSEFKGQAIHPMEGVSLRPALDGRALTRTRPLFWEHEGNRAVRSGNWKIVSTFPNDWELYDMAADRVERNDVAASIPISSSRSRPSGTRGPSGQRRSMDRAAAPAVGRRTHRQ